MAATLDRSTDEARQQAAAHLSQRLSARIAASSLTPITPENLPAGARQFYIEPQGLHGHGAISCIVLGAQAYCSGAPGEFARLLKDYRYFERRDLSAAQVMHLYRLLALPQQVQVLDRRYPDFPQLTPPAISHDEQGLSLRFYASQGVPLEPRQLTVTVTPDYRVEVRSGEVLKPQ